MALRHRQNPNQRQRIIVFVASPLGEGAISSELEELLATLKKNSVRINFVSLGTESIAVNQPLLDAIVARLDEGAAAEGDVPGSSVLAVSVGQSVLDACRREAALTGQSGAATDDPSMMMMDGDDMDPELAMALKLSLEEEQQRQAKLGNADPNTSPSSAQQQSKKANNKRTADDDEGDSMDEEMRMAIELSLQQQPKP